jgi:hypothetical protein
MSLKKVIAEILSLKYIPLDFRLKSLREIPYSFLKNEAEYVIYAVP